ncbi:putative LOC107376767-like protein [Nothobranchius furzeri]|uniref:LOC107376767-like protein n=1 Tax=Nothobranchius furzeri TaxID=105023 RepID=A0A9D3BLN1_NOTFU|nr:putative LOC107376767-like protein [Nothobranchius furzeri]
MSTGYGPRQVPDTVVHGRGLPPWFHGEEARYHISEKRFLAYMKTIGLKEVILGRQLATGANDAQEAAEFGRKNELAYAELCGCLDDKTPTLILYEAPDDGKKSLEILRHHFESEEKPQIFGLYTELNNVQMANGEELADYLARVEKIVDALNRAKETLSDALLVAMVLKGLTHEYDLFSVHATQTRETLTFAEFKARLRSFECTLRYRGKPRSDEVMAASYKTSKPKFTKEKRYFYGECVICEKMGHKARDCRDKNKKLWQKVVGAHSSNKVVTVIDTGQVIHNTKDKRKPAKEEE